MLWCQIKHHIKSKVVLTITYQEYTTRGLRVACTMGNDVLYNHGTLGWNLVANSKLCIQYKLSQTPLLLHQMQGKSISFTMQEPNAWV